MAEGVLIANGADSTTFFDALALSPVAAHVGTPILLTGRDSVPGATRSYLAATSPTDIIVGGGPATVTWATYQQLAATDRWFGRDRYEAATDIARNAVARGWSSNDTVGITARLPDGLTGGAAAGRLGGVQLVTATGDLPASAQHYLSTSRSSVDACYVFGGPRSISDSTRYEIADALD
jgi:hypothetical protein